MSASLRRRLLSHYRKAARDFPWRRTRDPYRIWVSEIMLQQTRTATVVERYERFLVRFPDVERLAGAATEEVCEEWAGLGYYSRARSLSAAARRVRDDHGGRVPADTAALRDLPGVGPYTAAAVASIAYGVRASALDGNAERVLSRVLADDRTRRGRPSRHVRGLADALVACTRPGDVNQALMDVGATICTPRRPRCSACPLRAECKAAERDPERYPAPREPRALRELRVAFAWIETSAGVWLARRPLGGLWGGLWELPSASGAQARSALAGRLAVELRDSRVRVRHDLTHRRVRAAVFEPVEPVRLQSGTTLRPHAAVLDAPLSALARKAITAYARGGRRRCRNGHRAQSPTCVAIRRRYSLVEVTKMKPLLLAVLLLATADLACTTSPLGRRQLVLFPASEMSAMGAAAFNEMRKENPPVADAEMNRYVQCVAQAVAREAGGPNAPASWDVVVFKDDSPNAFALPGGKIGVHSGLLKVAKTPDQLAAVIGHEIAHVLANHSNERVSTAFAAESGLQLAAALSGAGASATKRQLFGLLGVGTQVGVLLPFSRAQERESDLVGLDLMAAAGFDPRESITLWHNMAAAGGGKPPEFLSTHPGTETRIRDLEARMEIAMPIYERARAAGRRPNC